MNRTLIMIDWFRLLDFYSLIKHLGFTRLAKDSCFNYYWSIHFSLPILSKVGEIAKYPQMNGMCIFMLISL